MTDPVLLKELSIAVALGLIGGVIPGPVITAIFTGIMQSGFGRSLRIIAIAFFTETAVAFVSLLLFTWLGLPETFFRVLSLAGAAILVWIGLTIWRVRSLDPKEQLKLPGWKIVAMILSNGVLWTYWITICIPKAILLEQQLSMGAYLFMGLVQLGWLFSTLLLAFLFSRVRDALSRPTVVPVVFRIFSLAFFYFAADMLFRSVRYFFL